MIRSFVVYLILTLSLVVWTSPGFAAESAPAPSLVPPVDYPIIISLHPAELHGSASMRVGTYLIDDPLHIDVSSNEPGWYMQVHTTVLKGKDGEIDPADIYLVTTKGAIVLDQPVIIVQGGDVGQTVIEVAIELRTTQRYKPGTYEGQLLIIFGYPLGPIPQIIKIPFKVEVACSVSGSITGNKMYFHYGLPGESLSAIAEGEISTDTRVCLSLSVEKGTVDSLPMVKSFSGKKQRNEAHLIPLVWALQENGDGWRAPDVISFHGNEISWELSTGPEKIFYELQCSPRPDATQAPGDYAMRVLLSVVPIL